MTTPGETTPRRPMTSAERGRAYRARQEAFAALGSDLAAAHKHIAALESGLVAAQERIRALEAGLPSAQAEAHPLCAQPATQQDLEATAARHQAVASSALFLLSVLLHDGCSPMGTPRTGTSGGVVGA